MEPQKVWLRELGMVARERRDEVDDLEPLELEELDRAALLREALAQGPLQWSSLREGEGWLSHHRGEGRFPPAQGAALEAAKLQKRWLSLEAVLDPLGEEHLQPVQWGPWSGCPSLRGDALVLVHPAQDRAAQRLDLWLQLQLAAAALGDGAPRWGLLIARGSQEKKDSFAIQLTFQAPKPEAGGRELTRLWQLRQAWRTACWPVPPETGWSWFDNACPEAGTKAFEKVVDTWEGTGFSGGGERWREEMQVCFGSQRSLESLLRDLPFQEQAQELLAPLWRAIHPPKDPRC
jgi:exodeoxyribonuclease V gamma subunit